MFIRFIERITLLKLATPAFLRESNSKSDPPPTHGGGCVLGKAAGITQQQLADKIGKKRVYIAMLEKGETDMQLSTFIMISEAVGLKFALTY